jgi:hypothetical protein
LEPDLVAIRRIYWLSETVHNLNYFAPESRAATDALACKGLWMGYFGQRAAPMGTIGPDAAAALFVSFSPAMLRRALPDVWTVAPPERFLSLRMEVTDRVYRRVWGEKVAEDSAMTELAELTARAVAAMPTLGRPLAAANQALPLPNQPQLAFWQSLTTLREHRGDAHVALLAADGLDSVQALILACAYGKYPAELMRSGRKWSEDEWQQGVQTLAARGLVTVDGALTEQGRAHRSELEAATDRLAAAPYLALGSPAADRLTELLVPVARRHANEPGYPVTPPVDMPDPYGPTA